LRRYVPNCRLNDGTEETTDIPTNAFNTIKAAYWDAAERYYSVCLQGRTSVGNSMGQYNPNGRDAQAASYLNPDARYNELYNIRYVHNSGLDRTNGNSRTKFQPGNESMPNNALLPTTYNPESFAGEIRFGLPPAFKASFPMCIKQGTSTPTGSVSATVVQGVPVILPIRLSYMHLPPETWHLAPGTSPLQNLHLTPDASHLTPHTSHLTPHTSHLTPHLNIRVFYSVCSRTFVEATSSILYSAFARIEADALPASCSVVATTAPGVSTVMSSSLPSWALFSGLNVFIISATTATGTALTRLQTNAIR
jgi:hypothetical protein